MSTTSETSATSDPTAGTARAERFSREVADLKIPDPAAARTTLWLRTGAALMVVALALEVWAFFKSHGTGDPLVQGDATILAIGGVAVGIVGAALFVRYSLTQFLRFWMARQSYDLAQLRDHLDR